MAKGTVKWFNATKGFGFIVADSGGADVFLHHSQIAMKGYRTVNEGDKVSFEETTDAKGRKANNVQLI